MRHLLTKFIVAVLIFGLIVWLGLHKFEEQNSRTASDAAQLAGKHTSSPAAGS